MKIKLGSLVALSAACLWLAGSVQAQTLTEEEKRLLDQRIQQQGFTQDQLLEQQRLEQQRLEQQRVDLATTDPNLSVQVPAPTAAPAPALPDGFKTVSGIEDPEVDVACNGAEDRRLRRQVKSRIHTLRLAHPGETHPRVCGRIVTLSGRVVSSDELKRVLEAVGSVNGVRSVVNQLTIRTRQH